MNTATTPTRAPTHDLLEALERIEQLAKQTQLNIAAGMATTGVCGLRKIETAAQDARRHARADLLVTSSGRV